MIYQLDNKKPQFHGNNFIAPTAVAIGDVSIAEDVNIWFNVVIRADNDHIAIGKGSNIQDGCVLHVDKGYPMHIGAHVTVGHKAMLHGCEIGENTLIGINAVILNGAQIGKNCIIGANALIPEGMQVPDNSMVLGCPGKIVKQVTDEQQAMLANAAPHYVKHGEYYNIHGKIIG
ncbi:gamma carbonic anhydrase family protein [Thalassotalea maritima]|uniref:gamma carbonic anhydrase family protein n=1 Tax=Thalassotalea maritima TaxID=3242416 RepID=UPI0035272CE8